MSAVSDTIVAIATPPGRGGIGVVRVSGMLTASIAERVIGRLPEPRVATFGRFRNFQGDVIDEGITLYFPRPHSFTGEDVLELQGHGGPVVLDLILATVMQCGARLARPGEFTERAFLNDKIDLVQAEAIADLIDSASSAAVRAANRSLRGEFSKQIDLLRQRIEELRMYVEAAIDFPEEEIDFLEDGVTAARLNVLRGELAQVLTTAQQGMLLREGMTIVIAGRPNAGKSSLINCLAGNEVAIVTNIPGTTRDVIRTQIAIDGLPLQIIDTAGLRQTAEVVEQEGVNRAWREIAAADRVLLVVDDNQSLPAQIHDIIPELPAAVPVTLVRNKIDLSHRAPGVGEGALGPEVAVSALTGAGLDVLRVHLRNCMGFQPAAEGMFTARRRHVDALQQALHWIDTGIVQLEVHRAGELLAEDLRAAHGVLSQITGQFTSEDLLGKIFSSFCIGK